MIMGHMQHHRMIHNQVISATVINTKQWCQARIKMCPVYNYFHNKNKKKTSCELKRYGNVHEIEYLQYLLNKNKRIRKKN